MDPNPHKHIVMFVKIGSGFSTDGAEGGEAQGTSVDDLCNLVGCTVETAVHTEMTDFLHRVRAEAFNGAMAAIAVDRLIRHQNIWYRRFGCSLAGDLARAVGFLIFLLLVLCWLKLSNLWRRLYRRVRRQPAAS